MKNGGKRKGAGRRAGSVNKVTADVRALAGVHTPAAIKRLAHLAMNALSESAQVAACKELLDRGHGKSRQPLDVEGSLKLSHEQSLADLDD